MRADLVPLDVGHLPIGGVLDDVQIRLEARQPQQAVMIDGPVLRRNAEPNVIRIKDVGHQSDSARKAVAAQDGGQVGGRFD